MAVFARRPTADDIRRWQHALDAVAERERTGRGVVEPVRIEAGRHMLYAHFGELLTPIGGDFGVTDELELFGQIDWWANVTAAWTCPTSDEVVAEIGKLQATA